MKMNQSNIKKASKYLDKNMCVAIPTETVYGLAGNAYSDIAVKKIYKLKKRPLTNSLIVHYSNLDLLKNDCILNNNFYLLYKKFCPGPITFVLKIKKNSKISKYVNNKNKTLAVRFPKHKITQKLLNKLSYPIAAPSANIFSNLSPVSASDVKEEFGKKIPMILDGGICKIGLESTIISLVNKPVILRLGGLDKNKISKILKKNLKTKLYSKKNILPGQSKLHYSPGIPVRMNAKKIKKHEAFITLKKYKNWGKNYFYLSKKGKKNEITKNFYSTLRRIKNKGYKSIAIENINNKGIGLALNDRLKRASKK